MEQRCEIDMPSLRARYASTAGSLITGCARAFLDVVGQNKGSIVPVVGLVDGFAVKLRKKNKSQGSINFGGSIHKDIAKANRHAVLVQPYGVVEARKREKFNSDIRQRRSRTKLSMCCREDGFKLCHLTF